MIASKDDNKRMYADGAKNEAEEEVPLKKQKMMDDCNDIDGDSSSSSTDDYSSELEEEVSSKGETNLSVGSEEELLIW
jgi:hypothetical protein